MTADAELLEQYLALDTPTVSGALDGCGLPPGQEGLRPMWGRPRIAGFAVTVELEPLTGRPDGAHILTDVIAAAGADDIMVVANGGRTDVSCWGGIVSVGAAMRSVRGVVTDGACRDVEQARDLGFPVFARASPCRRPCGTHGVELAEIPHSAHWPMYSNPVAMRERIAGFHSRSRLN